MSLADVTSARSSPAPENCPECDATASVTSDLHKYQVACTCKPGSVQYACADDPGPPPPAKTDTPPALPPRPPTSVLASNRRNNAAVGCNADTSCRRRKYAWWCCGCGALAAALGGLLAAQHILVRAYTASPHHLETVPAAVPAAMLVLTGVCIMSLARRRNRYSYMIKVVGACCLMCALTCVLVTITTTVIHMNKLQTLKFCEYTKLTRTCTCFSMPPDTQHNGEDEGVRCVFEGVSECGVVHGALYWCLRGVFALSVSAVLVCIFSCMLAYQLLSHERKKMYWEQLELRCRSLYRPPSGQAAPTTGRPVQNTCSCCAQCHPAQPAWDISLQHRFWAPGRIGNLYSPNPGTGRKASAWSWFPWPRSNSQNSRCQMGGVPQSGDSAYGFCDDAPQNPQGYEGYPPGFQNQAGFNQNFQAPVAQSFTPSQSSFPPAQGAFQPGFTPVQGFAPAQGFAQYQEFGESSGSVDAQTGVWGPPPPYSPQGRSGSRHHLHQDPAAATLLHHHHIEVHRDHSCSYHLPERSVIAGVTGVNPLTPDIARLNHDRMTQDGHMNQDRMNMNQDHISRLNHGHLNQDGMNQDRMNHSLNHDGHNQDRNHMSQDRINQSHCQDRMSDTRLNQEMCQMNLSRMNDIRNQDRMNPDRINQEVRNPETRNSEMRNPDMSRMNQEMIRINPDMSRMNQEIGRMNPDMVRMNPDRMNDSRIERHEMAHMSQIYPEDMEMTHIQDGRFNTLRGHLVPYRCQRMDMSASNLHRDCRMDDPVTIECLHQKTASKVSDQSSDSCQKQGKENLGFLNDKHSPIRSSIQDCRVVNQNAESEVYFADVSSCCNVSVKADCCINPSVSLVGTIESHPESTSESEGSFTLTRLQRPQPQVGSKRRPKKPEKRVTEKTRSDKRVTEKTRQNNSLRLTEHQIEQLNMRMNEGRMERNDCRMNERDVRMNERGDRIDSRDRLNESVRESRDRLNDSVQSRDSRDRLSDSRNEIDRMNDSRISERMNETRISERMCDRMNESRIERMNDSRISERLNDSRLDRLNDSRVERMDRMNDSRTDRTNDSRTDRMNESRISQHDRMNDSRLERMTDLNSSIRLEGSPKRSHISPLRVPMPRTSPKLPKEHLRQSSSDSSKAEFVTDSNTVDSGCHSAEEKHLTD